MSDTFAPPPAPRPVEEADLEAYRRLHARSLSDPEGFWRERIGALRAWLQEGRAQSASFRESFDAVQQFVPLDIRQQAACANAE